ncbi:MAG TPA: class I SAM-dependent methyltransferase [Bacteroidales bacterium]|nr:class I SAM-dependent methyltransferase [Bacteroidales bacterium]
MKSLVELNKIDGGIISEKGTLHGYLPLYDKLFYPYRLKEINFFEIGFWRGASCKLMELYFPKAVIKYIDSDRSQSLNMQFTFTDPRVLFEYKDSRDLTRDYFNDFLPDIAIDDGSHYVADQVHFIRTAYPVIRPGGLLIVEDIQNIDSSKIEFDRIGIPYELIDFRPESGRWDDVLLIYRK